MANFKSYCMWNDQGVSYICDKSNLSFLVALVWDRLESNDAGRQVMEVVKTCIPLKKPSTFTPSNWHQLTSTAWDLEIRSSLGAWHQATLRMPRKCLKSSARRLGPLRWLNALKTSPLGPLGRGEKPYNDVPWEITCFISWLCLFITWYK